MNRAPVTAVVKRRRSPLREGSANSHWRLQGFMVREQLQKEQEATDEPARKYARPTESCKMYHRQRATSIVGLDRPHPFGNPDHPRTDGVVGFKGFHVVIVEEIIESIALKTVKVPSLIALLV